MRSLRARLVLSFSCIAGVIVLAGAWGMTVLVEHATWASLDAALVWVGGSGTLLLVTASAGTRTDAARLDPCALHDTYIENERSTIERLQYLRLVCSGGACTVKKRSVVRVLRRDISGRRQLARAAARLCRRLAADGAAKQAAP